MRKTLCAVALLWSPLVLAQAEAEAPAKTEKAAKTPPPDVSKLPFTQTSIRRVVLHHQPAIQECYEETLASKGDKVVEGKLLTSFTITPEGLVKDAKVSKKSTTLHDEKLHGCVVAVLSTMTFPKPIDHKDHPIEYPFNLKAIR